MEGEGCPQSFGKQINVGPNYLHVSVMCFESEEKIKQFEKKIEFSNAVNMQDAL